MKARRSTAVANGLGVATLAFLWLPLAVVVVYSFNAARLGAGWGGFTWGWYAALWRNEAALAAARTTLVLAFASAATATVLGTLLGYGLARYRFTGRPVADVLLQVPVFVPDIVYAVALLLWFSILRGACGFLEPGLIPMWLGHVAFEVPFVALVVRARAAGLDPSIEEAARDLGATPAQAFWHVTLPLLRPGVAAGALLAFTLSLDDFAVSFFTSGPGTATLPVLIYSAARRGITPDMNALSTLLIVATLVVVVGARGLRRGEGRDAGHAHPL